MRMLLCVCAVTVAAILCTQAQAGLVAAWTFDDDFAADVGGISFDLTAVNGATVGDAGGKFGAAATFECANSEYARTSGTVDVLGNGDFSYSAWYNFGVTDITGSDRYFVLETTAGTPPDGTAAWTASIGLRNIDDADSVQVFTHSPSTSVGATGSGTAGDWQNVIVTYDDSAGTVTAYLNGTEFDSASGISSTPVGGLVIGGHRSGTGRNFDGLIDDVAFYDHVLSSAEISSLQTVSAVPEPTSLALVGLAGFIGLCVASRRRRV